MKGEKKEQWMLICEKAATEQDPAKLLALIKEINRLLDEKHQRITSAESPQPTTTSKPT
jgi:hypothetical protein